MALGLWDWDCCSGSGDANGAAGGDDAKSGGNGSCDGAGAAAGAWHGGSGSDDVNGAGGV